MFCAVKLFTAAFEKYFEEPDTFGDSASAKLMDIGLKDIDARLAFSPHASSNAMLQKIADDINDKTTSCLFYSLAFLFKTKGAIRDAVTKITKNKKIFVYGISDKKVGGIELQKPDGNLAPVFPAALAKNVPAPFSKEPTGQAGKSGGTRMHHKFV